MATMLTQPATVLLLPEEVSSTPEPTIPPTYFRPERVHLAKLRRMVELAMPATPPT